MKKLLIARTIAVGWIWSVAHLPIADCSNGDRNIQSIHHRKNDDYIKTDVVNAMKLLLSLGVPTENLCTTRHGMIHLIPMCTKDPGSSGATADTPAFDWSSIVRSRRQRYLQEEYGDQEDGERERDFWFLLTHALCALACVTTAALAAGLTLGLLSLDPLLLLIRMRAGSTEEEKEQAATLLPIVKQHHLLLVTLLLLNSIANEALPLFLVCRPTTFKQEVPRVGVVSYQTFSFSHV